MPGQPDDVRSSRQSRRPAISPRAAPLAEFFDLSHVGTRGTKVPDRPEWIHEIKHDGYRLIVQRDGKRVRLLTRNGHDWSDRYPLIA